MIMQQNLHQRHDFYKLLETFTTLYYHCKGLVNNTCRDRDHIFYLHCYDDAIKQPKKFKSDTFKLVKSLIVVMFVFLNL